MHQMFHEYVKNLQEQLATGHASEGSHYLALKTLVATLEPKISVTLLPSQTNCGIPDFLISKGSSTIGYIEAKDIGKELGDIEKGKGPDGERFARYRASLPNIILTNYLEFRWYTDGQHRLTALLGKLADDGKVKLDKAGIEDTTRLLQAFLAQQPVGVNKPEELAQRMARLADLMRDSIVGAFGAEPEKGSLHSQLAAFRENLIPDLPVTQFADMYAQTLTYGLFAAKCARPDEKEFTRERAAYLIPKTNPFLQKVFYHIAGPALSKDISWLVDDLVQLLNHTDMVAVMDGFGKPTAKDDPVVYFYETFLKEYDPRMREMRGVYYTPTPVVSYIVRSIDYLLKDRFGKSQGLADENVNILDPAVGTATFLYMAVQEIYEAMSQQGQQGKWSDYVKDKLLPRLFGFELLMAPYAVAHLKLGLLLKETGYQFPEDKRLGIYLTNTLGEEKAAPEQYYGMGRDLAEEGNTASEIKRNKRVMVVLGNPPYSGHSANKGEWAKELVEGYKTVDGNPLGEKNPKWLQDDYVKFLAFGQWRIERTGQGILGFITNHSYLDNPTFRGMRQSLMNSFTDIYIFNLHGNAKKKEVAPDGGKDENVFDIQQGVAIGIFIKEPEKTSPATVHYADLWGLRDTKYHALVETDITATGWKELTPNSPYYFFVPQDEELRPEYEQWWEVTNIFTINNVGLYTGRDKLSIQWSYNDIENVIHTLTELTPEDARSKYDLSDEEISLAQKDVKDSGVKPELISKISYRPFDTRYTYYTGHSGGFHSRPRYEVMRHMLPGKNLGLIVNRQIMTTEVRHTWVTRSLTDLHIIETAHASAYLFPLYLYPAEGEMQFGGGHRRPNLNPEFIKTVSEKLGLKFIEDGKGDLEKTFGPEDIFNYAYALFHSPTYRTRYAAFLKIDFPRLPLTSDKELFKALVAKGAELVALHLMESPLLSSFITTYPVEGSHEVEKVQYVENDKRVQINKTQYFGNVPKDVWEFHVGGYQVAQKWLKDRKGRKLIVDDINHYQKIILALRETIRLMAEIDSLIPSWPLT